MPLATFLCMEIDWLIGMHWFVWKSAKNRGIILMLGETDK